MGPEGTRSTDHQQDGREVETNLPVGSFERTRSQRCFPETPDGRTIGNRSWGRGDSRNKGSVDWSIVEQTLPFVPPPVRAFITILFHSGCRVGELAKLTTGMLDRTDDALWVANLSQHKNSSKGKSRRLLFGPHPIDALRPLLNDENPDAFVFSPLVVLARQRKETSLSADCYSRNGLSQILRRAIRRAKVESWTLAMLRHSAACRIVDDYNLETARQLLGHSTTAMTRHYSKDAHSAAEIAAKKIG